MKIALHDNYLSERGTSIALFDYAFYLQKLFQYECFIFFDETNRHNNKEVVNKFRNFFTLCPYKSDFQTIDQVLEANRVELLYTIKSGENDGKISKRIKTCVHAVFPCDSRTHQHGNVYAYISKWLSDFCSDGNLPHVPHMLNLPVIQGNLRQKLNIPSDHVVIGRYGGFDSFDISFVHQTVSRVLKQHSKMTFLFCNTKRFVSHERVIYLETVVDLVTKTQFINTCDALLHARARGETFGLSVLEFMARNKPVFSYGLSPEQNHYQLLGGQGYLYFSADELFSRLMDFSPHKIEYKRLEDYFPEKVMEKFSRVFLRS